MSTFAHPRAVFTAVTVAATAGSLATIPVIRGSAANPTGPSFSNVSVSPSLAGGEPFVTYAGSNSGGPDLVYTSHEGTTHLFKDGIAQPSTVCDPLQAPQNLPQGFACSYTNQVNVWTSADHGQTWKQTTVGPCVGAGCAGPTSPFGLGFSDPDFTIDEGGYLYDTGIDLANDAVFASHDGGHSFLIGNNNCHSGDRPWLAGGDVPTDSPTGATTPLLGEVFLATDTTIDANVSATSGHEIFRGIIGTNPAMAGQPNPSLFCYGAAGSLIPNDPSGATGPGIMDFGAWQTTGSYSAAGKLFYDHNSISPSDGYHGALIDPAFFSNADGTRGVGISILKSADAAFATGSTVTQFTEQHEVGGYSAPSGSTSLAHWPSIAIDSNDVVYLVWDTPTTDSNGNYINAIKLATFDLKNPSAGFTTPITIAQALATPTIGSPTGTVLWPWVAVGNPGNVSVVWYQYDRNLSPDGATTTSTNSCDSASPCVFTMEKSIFGLGTTGQQIFGPNDAANGFMHQGGMCQGGTTCVATGQDRRLGDFFTNAVDENGCVLIATGETRTDPLAATSRPLYIQQTSGTSLTGNTCGALATATPEVGWTPLLVLVAGGTTAALLGVTGRRRRRRSAA
ncbi:MAG: hypothetical protein JOZ46_07205 [Candidatus Dormibacteraeota bacterium]|nr:hypothetical protein [Candidatus Dormibacteraeota bacterium]MBV9525584.1 hypothetical protein [Candidatus Dormibacteraeota bacterium]